MQDSSLSAKPSARLLVAWLALLLPPLLWAGNFIVGRAVRDDVTPMTLSLGRWTIALACLLPFAFSAMRREWRRHWDHRWLVLGTSITGVAAYNSLLYFGLRTTMASNALLLNALAPLLIVLLGAAVYGQRLSFRQSVGVGLSFIGVLTLVLQGHWSQWRSINFVAGDATVLVAAVCWAVYTLWLRQFPADLDRVGLMGTQILVALVVLGPATLVEYHFGAEPRLGPSSLAAIAYVGVFASGIAYLFYMRAVQWFGPAQAGFCIHLAPVFGVVLSSLFLHEHLYAYHAAGIATIAAGLLFSSRGDGRQEVSLPLKIH
ncbi:Permease of the drug/metabolite transporter (DMT) superfamily [Burkholderia sp. CF099]|nr:Permease of the drug/metabolite transporter (DMT) superfamily [Burkholderia sp. CF099]